MDLNIPANDPDFNQDGSLKTSTTPVSAPVSNPVSNPAPVSNSLNIPADDPDFNQDGSLKTSTTPTVSIPTPTITPTPIYTSSSDDITRQTVGDTSILQRYLQPIIPPKGPYDPDLPLMPVIYSDQVIPSDFKSNDSNGFVANALPKAHLANTLLDTLPEKLTFLQTQYPLDPSSGQPNWFGTDDSGHIVFSQDAGKTWKSFESITAGPKDWAVGHAFSLPDAVARAGAGLAAAPADLAMGGFPGPSMAASAAAAASMDVAKRSAAKFLGMTDQIIAPNAIKTAAASGALSQLGGNIINTGIGKVSQNIAENGLAKAFTPNEVSLSPALSEGANAMVKNGLNPLKTLPAVQSGFGPLVNGVENLPENVQMFPGTPVPSAGIPFSTTSNLIKPVINRIAPTALGVAEGAGLGGWAGGPIGATLGGLGGGALSLMSKNDANSKLANLISDLMTKTVTSPVYNPGNLGLNLLSSAATGTPNALVQELTGQKPLTNPYPLGLINR